MGEDQGDTGAIRLPRTWYEALRAELRVAFRPPFTAPGVVACNGALMAMAWFLLPSGLQDAVFSHHGDLAFPMVLGAWMLSDVPATNVLAVDAPRSLAALEDRPALLRILFARNAVLWALVAPLCAGLAVLIGARTSQLGSGVIAATWILLVPVGALGVSAWVGILFPYHPRDLSWRWDQRRRSWWQFELRWVVLVTAPYVLVTWLAMLALAPSLLVWSAGTHGSTSQPISDARFAIVVASSVAASTVMYLGGHRIGQRLVMRRLERLRSYLADPGLG